MKKIDNDEFQEKYDKITDGYEIIEIPYTEYCDSIGQIVDIKVTYIDKNGIYFNVKII